MFSFAGKATGKSSRVEGLIDRFEQGGLKPVFTVGLKLNHIVYDVTNFYTLCGRKAPAVSTERNGHGVVCPRCERIFLKALSYHFVSKYGEAAVQETGDSPEVEVLSGYAHVFASPRKLKRLFL